MWNSKNFVYARVDEITNHRYNEDVNAIPFFNFEIQVKKICSMVIFPIFLEAHANCLNNSSNLLNNNYIT